jgi:hypothetical protein
MKHERGHVFSWLIAQFLFHAACASTWSGINRTQVEVGTRTRGQLPEVESVQVHHLGPGRHEIVQELLLRVRASIHLS